MKAERQHERKKPLSEKPTTEREGVPWSENGARHLVETKRPGQGPAGEAKTLKAWRAISIRGTTEAPEKERRREPSVATSLEYLTS